MSINKYISYLVCNKGIIVNLYKLNFPSFHFFLKPNKRVFHPLTFPPLQPNTQEEKLNIFHPPTIFHPPSFPLLQPNEALTNKISDASSSQDINQKLGTNEQKLLHTFTEWFFHKLFIIILI